MTDSKTTKKTTATPVDPAARALARQRLLMRRALLKRRRRKSNQ